MKQILKKIVVAILILESKLILKKYKPTIIAVTGSVGKTSTKDAIYTVLSSNNHIRKSYKSFNNEIGIPLTIIGCQNGWNDPIIWIKNIIEGLEVLMFKREYPKCLVLEIGADHPGEIKNVGKWLKPDIAVITKVGEIPVHIEFYPTPESVLNEKMCLAKSLKNDGTLIIFADDARLIEASKEIKQKILTFGIKNPATISASNIEMSIKTGISFNINYEDNSVPVTLPGIIGNQQIYPIIAAATVGIARGVSISNIIESLKNHIAPRGRMNIIAGINGSYIIDDTYNSSPDAVYEALNTLSSLQTTGKKITILGDMMELGKYSAEEHKKVGEQALKVSNILITVGPRAKLMGDDNSKHFDSASDAGEYVKGIVASEDIILVKGSQSMRLERVSKALLAEPDKANELLVRQEEEWLNKK